MSNRVGVAAMRLIRAGRTLEANRGPNGFLLHFTEFIAGCRNEFKLSLERKTYKVLKLIMPTREKEPP